MLVSSQGRGEMRIAAGILMIIGGLIGGSIWLTIVRELITGLALSGGPYSPEAAAQLAGPLGFLIALMGVSPVAVAAIGGVMALKRVHYKWALAGAICSILFPFFGIPALVLLVKTRREFEPVAYYSDAIELRPDKADAYYKRGDAYDEIGEYEKAITDCSKAIERDPNHVDAYYKRGCAHHETGEYEKAIDDYSAVIGLDSGYASAYYGRGVASCKKGDVDRGIADLKRCIELSTYPELSRLAQQALANVADWC